MTIRQQILNSPETLSDLDWAAEERFQEGLTLLLAKRNAGGIYLLGLAAEMWLKLACFKVTGGLATSRVSALLAPAKQWMKLNAVPPINAEGYHSLLFWSEYLIQWRAARAGPLSAQLSGGLRHHVGRRLFQDWKIDLRYQRISPTENQCGRVYNDVVWVRSSWHQLWR